jgi:predicted DNA-binding transcriptional regulator AlpA
VGRTSPKIALLGGRVARRTKIGEPQRANPNWCAGDIGRRQMPIKNKKAKAKLAAARAEKLAALVNAARAKKLDPMTKWVPPKKRKGDRFVFKGEVEKRVGKTYPTIWQWMIDGVFPPSFAVGANTAWYESHIDHWMESRPRRRLKGDKP